MPRVSDEHLAARRQQILEAAWRCFARHGFHETSMQDVFAEAGLSAGAVYRYFPSKADLVRTTAEGVLDGVVDVFDEMLSREHPPRPDEAMRTTLEFVVTTANTGELDFTRIAIHAWSESLHDDKIEAVVQKIAIEFRKKWSLLAERWKETGDIPASSSTDQVAAALYGSMIGFVVQRHLIGDVTPEAYASGLMAMPSFSGRH